jgi:urea transport system substrate-binding protein
LGELRHVPCQQASRLQSAARTIGEKNVCVTAMSESRILSFGQFRLDPINQELWRGSELVEVRRKTFEALLYLVRNPRRLITHDELLKSVWAGSKLSSSLLRAYIWELRRVLGDTAATPRYLETLSGRGYRFIQQVHAEEALTAGLDANPGPDPLQSSNNERSDRDAPTLQTASTASIKPNTSALLVGILHSLVGTMAYSESPVVDATLLAIDEINRRGGLLGRRVEAIVADGKSDGVTFAREAESLLKQRKVSALFGCWMSAHRKQVLPIVEKYDGLMIYPVQYEGLESSSNIFYIGAAPNQQIIPAICWAFGFLNCRRFFLVGSDYIFPRTANQIVRDQASRIGAEIAGELYIPSGCLEVRDVVSAIAAAEPDLIVNTINGDSNIAFFRSLRAAGITPELIPVLSFSIGENELRNLDICGDYAAWNYFQTIERHENKIFLESFRSRYGPQRVTSDPMEAAYIGANLWAQAVAEAGSPNPAEVRAALRHQSFNAPEGLVHIDSDNQHTWKTIRIGQVREDGQFEVIYSSEKPIRPQPYPDTRSSREWNLFVDSLLSHGAAH